MEFVNRCQHAPYPEGRSCSDGGGGAFDGITDAQIANDKKVMQARIAKNKNDAESKARLRELSAEQRRREAAVAVKPEAPAQPPASAANKQGVKPDTSNGYPKKYDGNRNLRATAHAAIERAGDIGLDKALAKVEGNGRTVLENLILNGDVALYKPARTVQKTDKRTGRQYTAVENPVYTFDLPKYGFQLAVAIDPDRGQIRSIFPTSAAQEKKIAAWKKQCGPCWQEKNRADIKAQVERIDSGR